MLANEQKKNRQHAFRILIQVQERELYPKTILALELLKGGRKAKDEHRKIASSLFSVMPEICFSP